MKKKEYLTYKKFRKRVIKEVKKELNISKSEKMLYLVKVWESVMKIEKKRLVELENQYKKVIN